MDIKNISTEQLDKLSPEERKLALEILEQYAKEGSSDIFNNLIYDDYEEIPVDIDTFLHDKEYLGNGLIDAEGRFTVFPYWEETLKKIFPDNITTAYNTLVLTGSIGIGKSFMAVLCMLYLLHRILCLKDPYLYYGLQPIDKITFSLINITIEAAKGVAWDKFQQLVQTSPWFVRHGEITGRSEMVWNPNKRVELVLGSNNNIVIGRAVFCNFADEVNFGAMTTDVEKIKKKYKLLISQVDARMQSRFMKGNKLPTLQIIASSKNSDQSFLDNYIETKKKNESKTTLIIDEPQWIVRNDKESDKHFYVAVGNKFLPSEILPLDASDELVDNFRAKGYQMLRVPSGYYEAFNDNVELALTDIAGISSTSARKFISGRRLNECKIDTYQNPFTKDIIEVGTNDSLQYNQFFDLSKVPEELKLKPLYIHLDMSKSGDKTGIAGTWIMGRKASANIEQSIENYYRLAFSVSIKAPKGYEISFEKNRIFIRWLKEQGFNIKGISMDTYQSAQIKQQLEANGFKCEIISVDRLDNIQGTNTKVCLPYAFLQSIIYEKRVEIYKKCDLLTEEIIGLEKESDGHINHPDSGTKGSKDQVDALCGSLWAASQNLEEYAYDYGEDYEKTILMNEDLIEDNSNIKQQMIVDFEEELKKLNPLNGLEINKKNNNIDESDISFISNDTVIW